MARQFGYRHGISVLQIVAFSFALPCAVWMACTRRNGWFGIGGLSIIRLVGASCLLATLSNNSRRVWAGAYVCENLGIALLTFLLLGILERANRHAKFVHRWAFSVPYTVSWAGMGVSVGEFITASRRPDDDDATLNGWGLAGTIMFLLFFVTTSALAAVFFRRRAELPDGERAQVKCVAAACLPAMVVRIVYSLVGRFPGPARGVFSPIRGDPTAYLLMTALPELLVVGACTAVILRHGRDWRVYYKSAASEEVVHGDQDGLDLRGSSGRV
ncbi:hypothetical protein MGG_06584 [Pyricularia oryzae 70-15]|uniref:DUF7702 domain-containing protein n=3 Tax=Pyricularia oryzae TaxID=318829 RepID=G4N6B0_PYRO7|nr:uncharacterized protein MGG_06584 [Pyricularia oryzae 70-15]EHA50632.1 hypothetical protein MGG_06584 [Pyricularia oryzae 70-15]ELQ42949.1 hypothetical protein OOU_Y34scaffold00182g19 [Pyricularia oryzae Y34]KAI7912782.1 hypothetical protein M9X92_009823 [Pyricularia oryzae]KAI7915922.1 hypothetical protein M0657_008840 [Pyricularia oryzae]